MRVAQGKIRLWLAAAALGAALTLMTSFGLVVALLFLILLVPLLVRGGLAALSGLLTGFGSFWSILVARQLASGGTTDNVAFWMAVGVVPLVIGATLLLPIVARTYRGERTVTPR